MNWFDYLLLAVALSAVFWTLKRTFTPPNRVKTQTLIINDIPIETDEVNTNSGSIPNKSTSENLCLEHENKNDLSFHSLDEHINNGFSKLSAIRDEITCIVLSKNDSEIKKIDDKACNEYTNKTINYTTTSLQLKTIENSELSNKFIEKDYMDKNVNNDISNDVLLEKDDKKMIDIINVTACSGYGSTEDESLGDMLYTLNGAKSNSSNNVSSCQTTDTSLWSHLEENKNSVLYTTNSLSFENDEDFQTRNVESMKEEEYENQREIEKKTFFTDRKRRDIMFSPNETSNDEKNTNSSTENDENTDVDFINVFDELMKDDLEYTKETFSFNVDENRFFNVDSSKCGSRLVIDNNVNETSIKYNTLADISCEDLRSPCSPESLKMDLDSFSSSKFSESLPSTIHSNDNSIDDIQDLRSPCSPESLEMDLDSFSSSEFSESLPSTIHSNDNSINDIQYVEDFTETSIFNSTASDNMNDAFIELEE